MNFPELTRHLPSRKNAALAILSAVLLVLAFPDFEFWFLAWFGLAPLLLAVEHEKESSDHSFVLGWIFGFVFFTGTCWWLTFAPITYAGFSPIVAYLLLFCVTAIVGIFPGIFATILSRLLRRFGSLALFTAPFVWVFAELLRYWITGNNWNALGYSQAFAQSGQSVIVSVPAVTVLRTAEVGGVLLVGFFVGTLNSAILYPLILRTKGSVYHSLAVLSGAGALLLLFTWASLQGRSSLISRPQASVVAVQPNVPMSGLFEEKWRLLRQRHIELSESSLKQLTTDNRKPTTVIFPESPMNFMFEEDEEFRNFVHAFAAKNDVNVLFNSAEPDASNNKYFNSAVLVGPDGKEIAQYDKIYLLPFGESVPAPLQAIVPAFVGIFSYGKEYDLLPLGDSKAGVMICFESHFGELSRRYVRDGADVLIEMTNDGYLGPTPVLRQHLANAVFRAVETNRPVLRVTNVGITAYINERGEVLDETQGYTEDTRVWSVGKSDGRQTFYVKYGDWFGWLCSIVSLVLLALTFKPKKL
ncbi:MAG TPA: apolipoprotein N-acyltransferase [Pyrinomonadaceae bacterium]|nr:apolipoprotein N-acyltransferase [Pyrinomonadaceae bacterium]